jgi:glyceraldehyde-3-phosphate dehydrogenase/erythrose-4-phosphate dehydrogenase
MRSKIELRDISNFVKIPAGYENELSYSCRLVDMVKRIEEKGVKNEN